MKNLTVINHPLVQQKLGLLRNNATETRLFRVIVRELSLFLVYEAMRSLRLEDESINTWNGQLVVKKLSITNITLVPIMRAGIGMLRGALNVFPEATVNFLGIVRDEATATPHVYYNKPTPTKIPQLTIVLDPMLATGGSLVQAIKILKKQNCNNILTVCIIASPEGIKEVNKHFPEVNIFCGSLDSHLNSKKYIIPGLGDAGDRLFGT